jgi:mannose-6-phosphate isomerase
MFRACPPAYRAILTPLCIGRSTPELRGALQMNWYPLQLSYHVRTYAFGERLIPDMLGKSGVPDGIVAETWEVSDQKDARATILNGELEGHSFHDAVLEHPEEIVGTGWSGPHFPLLAKFLDASNMLPVHLHADDETAAAVYAEPNGKSEAWHILWAEPGATILAGIKDGATDDELVAAFKRQDYDAVMYSYPIEPGDTVYVPGGILHSFGPNTLIFEIQQTSDLAQNVMPVDLLGNQYPEAEWDANIAQTLAELKRDYLPVPNPGLTIQRGRNAYRYCCAGPHFALERWSLRQPHTEPAHPRRCMTISCVGDPVALRHASGTFTLERATSCVSPAALGEFVVEPSGVADLIVCYVPDLAQDIVAPLRDAGYSNEQIAALGKVPLD